MTNEIPEQIWSLYRIINKINGKIYIGQAAEVSKRWYDHRRAVKLNKPTQIVHRAMIKYGLDNFEFEVIASCKTQEDANETETELVRQYDSFVKNGKGYNATFGGMNAPKTEEWKQIMRDIKADPIFKNKMSTLLKQSWNESPERKQQLSEHNKNLWQDTEYRKNMLSITEKTQFKRGRIVPEEIKEAISKANSGKVAWNKNIKGIMKPNKTSFKVGQNIGENNVNSKLNWSIVSSIRKDRNDGLSYKQLADKYQISKSVIAQVVTFRTWKVKS